MLKGLFRYLLILIVVCLLAGGVYLAVIHNPNLLPAGSQPAGFDRGQPPVTGVTTGSTSSTLPTGALPSEREGGHDELNSSRALSGIGQNVLIIGLVTLGVAGLQKLPRLAGRPQVGRAG